RRIRMARVFNPITWPGWVTALIRFLFHCVSRTYLRPRWRHRGFAVAGTVPPQVRRGQVGRPPYPQAWRERPRAVYGSARRLHMKRSVVGPTTFARSVTSENNRCDASRSKFEKHPV